MRSSTETVSLLEEVAEVLEGYSDVRDSPDGPRPNAAMSMLQAVEQEIERLKRSNGPVEGPCRCICGVTFPPGVTEQTRCMKASTTATLERSK